MHRFILSAFIIYQSISSYSQSGIYLGIEQFYNRAIYYFVDYGSKIKPHSLTCSSFGVNFGYDINKSFSIEGALIRNHYSNGYGFGFGKSTFLPPISTVFNVINIWQIPVRLKSRISIYKDKLFLTSSIGYHFCINSNYSHIITHWDTLSQSQLTISYSESIYSIKKKFSLIETNMGMEYKISKKIHLDLQCLYFIGFTQILQVDIDYKFNNDPIVHAIAYTKGEYWGVGINLKFLLPIKKTDHVILH